MLNDTDRNTQRLIHMNGRVYDYNLGRFLSVDPFIQAPTSTQSINPYSYIMNNPLAGTDPTGYLRVCDTFIVCSPEDIRDLEKNKPLNLVGSGSSNGNDNEQSASAKPANFEVSAKSEALEQVDNKFTGEDFKLAFSETIDDAYKSTLELVLNEVDGAFSHLSELEELKAVINNTSIFEGEALDAPRISTIFGRFTSANATMEGSDTGYTMTLYPGFFDGSEHKQQTVFTKNLESNPLEHSKAELTLLRTPISGDALDRQIYIFAHELYHGTRRNESMQSSITPNTPWPDRQSEQHASQKAVLFTRRYGNMIRNNLESK